jgi:hypothetical protein
MPVPSVDRSALNRFRVLLGLPFGVVVGVGGGRRRLSGRGRPLFENCTVDASIFCRYFCVFKLVRAHGGCLGTRSR